MVENQAEISLGQSNSVTEIPVNFSTEHKQMLGHTKMTLEDGHICINKNMISLSLA